MTIATAVTDMSRAEEVTDHPKNGGRFVHGLYIEGAAWMHDEEECEDYDVNGVTCRYVGGSCCGSNSCGSSCCGSSCCGSSCCGNSCCGTTLWQQLLLFVCVVAREF
jgi:hypothetical protein